MDNSNKIFRKEDLNVQGSVEENQDSGYGHHAGKTTTGDVHKNSSTLDHQDKNVPNKTVKK